MHPYIQTIVLTTVVCNNSKTRSCTENSNSVIFPCDLGIIDPCSDFQTYLFTCLQVPLPGEEGVEVPGDDGVEVPGEEGVVVPGEEGVVVPGEEGVEVPGDEGVVVPGEEGIPVVVTSMKMIRTQIHNSKSTGYGQCDASYSYHVGY